MEEEEDLQMVQGVESLHLAGPEEAGRSPHDSDLEKEVGHHLEP